MSFKYEIGVLGSGNMGSAILKGLIITGKYPEEKMAATRHSKEGQMALREMFPKSTITGDNRFIAGDCKILVLAVKPYMMGALAQEIKDLLSPDQILVSVAAGLSLNDLEELFATEKTIGKLKIVRTMPNICSMVLEGMTAVSDNGRLSENELEEIMDIFSRIGKAERVGEPMIEVATGLSGSSTAYVYMFIEALADAGVAEGMPRKQSYEFAAQAVLGAAKLVLESGKHPGQLKDETCSPKGTTIEGVNVLEDGAFRSVVMNAVRASIIRSRELNNDR